MNQDQTLHPLADVSAEIRQKRYRLATKEGYLELLKSIFIMILIILLSFHYVFTFTTADGTNMYPAILDGDLVLGYRLDRNYVKNDVVVCTINGREQIGRVVAKGGDSVNITDDGILYVNGTQQTGEIAFITEPGKQTYPYIVPEGNVYLLGDFRTRTYDSRDYGPVSLNSIKSKVVCIFRRRGI